MKTFGKRLRAQRLKKGLTQKSLAQKFKISESTIGMYERDEREPSFELVNQLAEFFECSTDYLLGRVDDPHLYSNREEAERAVRKKGFIDLEGLSEEQIKAIQQLVEQLKKK